MRNVLQTTIFIFTTPKILLLQKKLAARTRGYLVSSCAYGCHQNYETNCLCQNHFTEFFDIYSNCKNQYFSTLNMVPLHHAGSQEHIFGKDIVFVPMTFYRRNNGSIDVLEIRFMQLIKCLKHCGCLTPIIHHFAQIPEKKLDWHRFSWLKVNF